MALGDHMLTHWWCASLDTTHQAGGNVAYDIRRSNDLRTNYWSGNITNVADVANGGTRALEFSGDRGELLTAPNQAGEFSLSFWAKRTSATVRCPIFSADNSGSYSVYTGLYNATLFQVSTQAGNAYFTIPANVQDAWTHYVVTRDVSNLVRVYVNGTESSTGAQTLASTFWMNTWGGTYEDNSLFTGRLDDVRAFSGVLTSEEITALAASRAVVTPAVGFDARLNFRNTAGHITDNFGETPVLCGSLSVAGSDQYPTTRNGLTFGCVQGTGPINGFGNSGNVSGNVDPRLGGYTCLRASSAQLFRLDLLAPGWHFVEMLGVTNSTLANFAWCILDGTTQVNSIYASPADNTPWTAANTEWRAHGNATGSATSDTIPDLLPGVLVYLTNSYLQITYDPGFTSNCRLSHMRVRDMAAMGFSSGSGGGGGGGIVLASSMFTGGF